MSKQSNLLAYFGSDLALRNSVRYLRKANASGYALLALDSHAMALATRAQVPYTLLDDWLDPETIVNSVQVARDCGTRWFEPARGEFTVDGVCLPELDRYNMDWFWQDAFLSLELASKVKSAGITKFKFFGNLFPRAAILHAASDVCSRTWQAELPGVGSFATNLEAFSPSSLFSTLRKVLGKLKTAGAADEKASSRDCAPFTPGSVVIVLRYEEDLRFSHLVTELCGRFPGKVAAVIGSHSSEKSENVFDTWDIPVSFSARWPLTSWLAAFPSWLLPTIDPELQRRFLSGYRKALDASQGRPWQRPMEILKFHFSYYCRYRWPFLYKHNFRFWSQLWGRTQPRALLVTGEAESVFVLASHAAAQLNIPTIVIPHACGGGRLIWEGLFKGTMLYNSRVQQRHFERSGVSDATLQACAGLVAKNEYPVHRVKTFSGNGKCRVLALTEATGEGPHLNTYTSPSANLTALRALVDPPPDLSGKIDMVVKTHPHISDLPMLEAAGPAVLQRLMPRASELESALKETDLVVAVNYRGGAMVHAFRMAMPIIYFLAEKEPMLRRPDYPYDTFLEGTAVARNAEDFWNLVRRSLADPDFVMDLRSRSADFARDNLTDDQYPGLAELIEDLAPAETPERRCCLLPERVHDRSSTGGS